MRSAAAHDMVIIPCSGPSPRSATSPMKPESHLLHRQLRAQYPLAVHAEGCVITDASGKTYLDASGGAAVSCLGHAHRDVLAAIHAQIDRIAYAHTSFFSTDVAEKLA